MDRLSEFSDHVVEVAKAMDLKPEEFTSYLLIMSNCAEATLKGNTNDSN